MPSGSYALYVAILATLATGGGKVSDCLVRLTPDEVYGAIRELLQP